MQQLPVGPTVDWTPASPPERVQLRGSHVLLRPLDPVADAEALYTVSHSPDGDPAVWTYLFDGPYEGLRQFGEALEEASRLDDPLFFTLVRLGDHRPLGMASYLRIVPEHGTIEIGNIWFGPPLQRTTAATEAIYLLVSHAFDELGYRRVEWKCNALNAASRRAAARFGFSFEGIFHQHFVIKGRNRDTAWYAITDAEWPAVRAGFESWLRPDNFDAGGAQKQSLGQFIDGRR
jgi:RimJ/RimL family protein N-acetyltransferase